MRALIFSVLSISLAQAGAAEVAIPVDTYVVELDEQVAGLDRAAYANDWWQWAVAAPQSLNPITDMTGDYCGVNQMGPVWYLASGLGTSLIKRSCTVPKDQYIFFPVINMLAYPPRGTEPNCEDMKSAAAQNNIKKVYLRVSLDGSELQNAERFRVASSECFNLTRRSSAENTPPISPSATDGYWIMLRPLPPGKHMLEFQASYSNLDSWFGTMSQDISYTLTVLDE